MRAGGSGIPGFYTATGVGTQVAEGGLPWKYDTEGNVIVLLAAEETKVFATAEGEKEYVLEEAIVADFGLVRAWKGDRPATSSSATPRATSTRWPRCAGGSRSPRSSTSSSPASWTPTRSTRPASSCSGVVELTPEQAADKRIEKVTTRPRPDSGSDSSEDALVDDARRRTDWEADMSWDA